MSALTKCPLYRDCFIRVWLTERPFLDLLSVLRKCPLYGVWQIPLYYRNHMLLLYYLNFLILVLGKIMKLENGGIAQPLVPAISTVTIIVSLGPYLSEYYFYYTISFMILLLFCVDLIAGGSILNMFRTKDHSMQHPCSRKRKKTVSERSKENIPGTLSTMSSKSETRKSSFNSRIKAKVSIYRKDPHISEESNI